MTAALLPRPTSLFPGAAPVHDPAPLCVVGRRPHTATDGRLCRHHLEEIGNWLHDIETEAKRLVFDPDDPDGWTAAPSAAIRYDGGSSTELASQRSPVVLDPIVVNDPRSTAHGHRHIGPVCHRCPTLAGRRCTCPPLTWRRQVHWAGCPRQDLHPSCLHVLADRDEHDANAERLLSVFAVLHGLAQRVRDERMLGVPVRTILVRVPPGHEGVYAVDSNGVVGATTLVPAQLTVHTERDVLTRQLDWIARQPWILDMRREVADLREQLLRANSNRDDQPLPGHCTWFVDGEECAGDLWPAEPLHTSGYETTDGTRAVVCGRNDKHRYEGPALARLSVVLEQQRREEAAS